MAKRGPIVRDRCYAGTYSTCSKRTGYEIGTSPDRRRFFPRNYLAVRATDRERMLDEFFLRDCVRQCEAR